MEEFVSRSMMLLVPAAPTRPSWPLPCTRCELARLFFFGRSGKMPMSARVPGNRPSGSLLSRYLVANTAHDKWLIQGLDRYGPCL